MLNQDQYELKKKFWDKKILDWDNSRYSRPKMLPPFFDVNQSIKNRLSCTINLLKLVCNENSTILDLGAGTGRILERIAQIPFQKYIAVDISDAATSAINEKAKRLGLEHKVEVINGDIGKITNIRPEIVLSNGLLDWLTRNEIEVLKKNVESKYFIHSFSIKKVSFHRLFHLIHVFLSYGHKNTKYVPKYYKQSEIINIFKDKSINIFFKEVSPLSFLVHNIENDKK